MDKEQYTIASLKPDQVEEIRLTEQRLSEHMGQTITLIAYQADETSISLASEQK
jgi:hypothetical protein